LLLGYAPGMTEFAHVLVKQDGPIATLTFNHPEILNAVSPAMLAGAMAALDHIDRDAKIRALILTGAGKGFCAGANISADAVSGPIDAGALLEQVFHPFLRRLRDFRTPVVVAVNGPAVGIGMSFALHGDLVMAARSAFFQLGFSKIGLVPDGGATWLLPRLIGLARARELALLADKLSAEKALDWGLINAVADDEQLMAEAMTLARRLAEGPASLALTRRLFRESPQNAYEQQLSAEQAAQSAASRSGDFQEGLKAFREKRPPRFTGE
jgi:2-(1,2-epoxy-1,2-dihydrophenyl)acetyl-CoA isomerase